MGFEIVVSKINFEAILHNCYWEFLILSSSIGNASENK